MQDTNLWLAISDYENIYECSEFGIIKSLPRTVYHPRMMLTIKEKILKQSIMHNGYLIVTLSKNGIQKKQLVHIITATLFVPNPYNYKCVNHKDCNKLNNYYKNLEWCTHSQNMRHAILNGRRPWQSKNLRLYE